MKVTIFVDCDDASWERNIDTHYVAQPGNDVRIYANGTVAPLILEVTSTELVVLRGVERVELRCKVGLSCEHEGRDITREMWAEFGFTG